METAYFDSRSDDHGSHDGNMKLRLNKKLLVRFRSKVLRLSYKIPELFETASLRQLGEPVILVAGGDSYGKREQKEF